MPNSFQYPLERQRDLQRKWGRLLQRTAASTREAANAYVGSTWLLLDTMAPRVPNNDDDQEDEDEDEDEEDEKREPAVIREPDKDE